jgi:DNA-binding GntR family transcriptional regulator
VLRQSILSGDLRPGDRIVELKVARSLGVSQTPVREALASLEREGLVIKVDHSRTFVSQLESGELREVLTLRAVLEGYCARLCAPRFTDSDQDILSGLVGEMRQAARRGDLRAVTDADLRFHEFIYSLSNHRLLREVLQGLQQRLRLALAFADAVYSPDLADIAASHVPVIEALSSRDPELAARAAGDHVLSVLPSLDEEP